MKKKKLNGLSLNKKVIANLNTNNITGGFTGTCVGEASCGNCTQIAPCGGNGTWQCATVACTRENGCTRDTIELSYCQTITIPDPCLSVGACA